MFDSIISEIVNWQMWQRVMGKEPKQIKLAPHHVRALHEWINTTTLVRDPNLVGGPEMIFGMEIVRV